ncbi:hypothetical protein GCM10022209_23740 [Chitinophaga oryziterrae]
MKRAKIMLAAIAVLAIAGGVYASKAKREGDVIFTKTNLTSTLCTISLPLYTLTKDEGAFYTTTYAATTTTAPCTILTSVYHGE